MTKEQKKQLRKKMRDGDLSRIAYSLNLTLQSVTNWFTDRTRENIEIEMMANHIAEDNQNAIQEKIKKLKK